MKKIEAILFDFGGTLDSDGLNWFRRFHALIVGQGASVDWDRFEGLAREAADYMTTLADTGHLTMDALAHRLVEQIHQRMGPKMGAKWHPTDVADEFMTHSGQHLRGSRQLLAELARKFRLGCISNNWGNTAGWCEEFQLAGFFETIIDSTVVGATKPDRAIFQAALEELQLPAASCVYVGDWYPADMVGANRAGLKTIWVTDGKTECPDESVVDHRVTRLGDLLELAFLNGA